MSKSTWLLWHIYRILCLCPWKLLLRHHGDEPPYAVPHKLVPVVNAIDIMTIIIANGPYTFCGSESWQQRPCSPTSAEAEL